MSAESRDEALRHGIGQRLLLLGEAEHEVDDAPAGPGRVAVGQERLSGLGVAYPAAGKRAPDLRLASGATLFELLRGGRHVLLDLSGAADEPDADVEWHSAPLAPSENRPDWAAVSAALIRPDGHVAWAGDEPADTIAALRRSLYPTAHEGALA